MGGYRDNPLENNPSAPGDPSNPSSAKDYGKDKAVFDVNAALQKVPKDTSTVDGVLAQHAAQRTALTKKGRASTFLGSVYDSAPADDYVADDPATPKAVTSIAPPGARAEKLSPNAHDVNDAKGTWSLDENGHWTYEADSARSGTYYKPVKTTAPVRDTPLGVKIHRGSY